MMPLPTLGGNNAAALFINELGQVVGFAENNIKDSTCAQPFQVPDFEAAIWSSMGQIQELPPLPGDTVGFALYLNNNGLVAGSSGRCANTIPAGLASGPHAVLWDNGVPINLGSLGGSLLGAAAAVNDLGQVVGCVDLASELPGFPGVQCHSFLWTAAAGMQDTGTVGTDFSALPTAINNKSQSVGASCDDMGNCRAYLWQNNVMTDPNALIPANSPLYLIFPPGIDDAGEIVGTAIETSTGDAHAFLAVPVKTGSNAAFAPAAQSLPTPMPIPEGARKILRRRMGLRGW